MYHFHSGTDINNDNFYDSFMCVLENIVHFNIRKYKNFLFFKFDLVIEYKYYIIKVFVDIHKVNVNIIYSENMTWESYTNCATFTSGADFRAYMT